jgi:hypothetical protein
VFTSPPFFLKENDMNTAFRHLLAIVILFAVSSALPVYAQESFSPSDEWEIRLMPYVWMPSLDADTTVNGLEGTVDLNFGDVLDSLDFIAMGRMEAWKGKWGVTFDFAYLDLGTDGGFKGLNGAAKFDLDIAVRLGMADHGLAYRLLEQKFGNDHRQKLTFEPYGGLRYVYLKQEVTLDETIITEGTEGIKLGKSEDWVEPFIGARIVWDLNNKTAINVRFDAGGFGI